MRRQRSPTNLNRKSLKQGLGYQVLANKIKENSIESRKSRNEEQPLTPRAERENPRKRPHTPEAEIQVSGKVWHGSLDVEVSCFWGLLGKPPKGWLWGSHYAVKKLPQGAPGKASGHCLWPVPMAGTWHWRSHPHGRGLALGKHPHTAGAWPWRNHRPLFEIYQASF